MFQPRSARTELLFLASASLLITSIHHVYGAIAFETPWRFHVVPIAVITETLLLVLIGRNRPRRVAEACAVVLALAIPFLGIGIFEGLYNHVLKIVLAVFGGETLMREWFPAPIYELPNDIFFEVTGVIQAILAPSIAHASVRVLRKAAPTAKAAAGN